MSRRRPSLMDILEEEHDAALQPVSPPEKKELPTLETTSAFEVEPASEKFNKADYIRLSITVPPDMFERIQHISLQRRREKQPYTFCHLARQAILEWLDQQEKDS